MNEEFDNLIRQVFGHQCQQFIEKIREPNLEIQYMKSLKLKEIEYEEKLNKNNCDWSENFKEFNNLLAENLVKQSEIIDDIREQLIKSVVVAERDVKSIERDEKDLMHYMDLEIEEFDRRQKFLMDQLKDQLNQNEINLVEKFINDWDKKMNENIDKMKTKYKIDIIDENNLLPSANHIENSGNIQCNDEIIVNDSIEGNQSNNSFVIPKIDIVKPKKVVKFSDNDKQIGNKNQSQEIEKLFFTSDQDTNDTNNGQIDFCIDGDNSNNNNQSNSNMFEYLNNENFKSDFELDFSMEENWNDKQ